MVLFTHEEGCEKTVTKEDGFERVIRAVSEEIRDVESRLQKEIKATKDGLERRMDEGFSGVNRRLDDIVQPQLDNHAHRIKKIETKVFLSS